MHAASPFRWCRAALLGAVAGAAALGCLILECCPATPPDACSYLANAAGSRSGGAAFLASYPTAGKGPLHDAAFLYDNALAAIALVGCGKPHEAARIGDAILLALDHDRYWHDGRLRNAYQAGPVGTGSVKLAGWWDAAQNRWVEDRYQVASDSGNMAWAMLALLALDKASGDRRYLEGAVRIGNRVSRWITNNGPGGFSGGTLGYEPDPQIEPWKSTEHNSDLAAAFTGLARATGDRQWLVPARRAQKFVSAMWSAECDCFAAGTGEDGVTPNRLLALDAQVYPLLAITGARKQYGAAQATVERKLSDNGGLSYSDARAGLWTEGTAQFALLAELSGRKNAANGLIQALSKVRAADGSYYATDARELPTGLVLDTDSGQTRKYFHIPHLAATAWVAIAQRRYNPFTQTHELP